MKKHIAAKNENYSILDNNTGEIAELYERRKITIEQCMMCFFITNNTMMKLTGLQLKVMMRCWKFSTYATHEDCNIFENNKRFKELCINDGLDASALSINVAITELCKKGLLIRKYRGTYMLNPKYFFKGTLSDRSKLIMCLEKESIKNINQNNELNNQ